MHAITGLKCFSLQRVEAKKSENVPICSLVRKVARTRLFEYKATQIIRLSRHCISIRYGTSIGWLPTVPVGTLRKVPVPN